MATPRVYLCFFVLCVLFEASYQLKCYECDASATEACGDPPGTEKLPTVECSITVINITGAALKVGQSVTDGKFYGTPISTDNAVKQTEGTRNSTDEDYDFYCGKVTLKAGDQEAIQRGCLASIKGTEDVCGSVKTGYEPIIQISSCNLCTEDLCNSSSNIIVSCTLVLLGLIGLFVL